MEQVAKNKKQKKSYQWDKDSGYDLEIEKDDNQKEEKQDDKKGWKRTEYESMIPDISESKKQMHLTDKCPNCGTPNVFKWKNISKNPPQYMVTCMNRPSSEKAQQLKKMFGKDVASYELEIAKEFCGQTFLIQ